MFKSVFAATAALSMSAGAALAGPYVNILATKVLSVRTPVGTFKAVLLSLPLTVKSLRPKSPVKLVLPLP